MGLTMCATGLSDRDTYNCGNITFLQFRIGLAKAYNEEFGMLYEHWLMGTLEENQVERLNELSNEDLDIFLEHCDCDGRMTPGECKKVYDVIKDLKMDMIGHNYGIMETYNMLEQWKGIFKHCYKRRVILYFI